LEDKMKEIHKVAYALNHWGWIRQCSIRLCSGVREFQSRDHCSGTAWSGLCSYR
jgi:hypothetical protein